MSRRAPSLSVIVVVIAVLSLSGSEATTDPCNEELLERIIQLEKKVDQSSLVKSQYEENSIQRRLSRQLKVMESRITRLLVQQEKSNHKQSDLEARIIELEEQALHHESTIEQQRGEIDMLKTQTDSEYNDDQEVQDESLPVEKRIHQRGKIRRAFPETPVAFTAVLDHNVAHSGIDQTVIFNKVLLNDGNAYNSHTGIFSVPREGLYLFYFVFAAGYEPHKLWMHIVVDGQGKASGVADTLQAGHDAQGTNLVLLHLQKGDSVWVTTYTHDGKSIYGASGLTSFSGVLLNEY